jgi:hypothetical protein
MNPSARVSSSSFPPRTGRGRPRWNAGTAAGVNIPERRRSRDVACDTPRRERPWRTIVTRRGHLAAAGVGRRRLQAPHARLTPLVEAELAAAWPRGYMPPRASPGTHVQTTALVNEGRSSGLTDASATSAGRTCCALSLGFGPPLMRRVLSITRGSRGILNARGGARRVTLDEGLVLRRNRRRTWWRWIGPSRPWPRSTLGRAG